MKRFKTLKSSRTIAQPVLRDYLLYLSNYKRIIINNFVAGVFRGLGMSLGFTVISAVTVYIATVVASKNLPIIGDILREILNLIHYGR